MLTEIFGLFGLPACAKEGCGMPGIVRFEFSDENGPVWVNLCPSCVTEIKKCLETVSTLMDERREGLQAERDVPLLPPPKKD